jgi:hypothetical protein
MTLWAELSRFDREKIFTPLVMALFGPYDGSGRELPDLVLGIVRWSLKELEQSVP